jgi:hypothetical protein
VLEKWYGGPKSRTGEPLYPGGIPFGSEPFWPRGLLGDGTLPGVHMIFTREYIRYLAFVHAPGETYSISAYRLDRDLPKARELSATYDSANPDLSKFKEKGRKLLLYQGWADAIVTPFRTVAYYEAVQKAMGGRVATEPFARLFMVPGMDHCGLSNAGPGIDQFGFDPLTALEQWVEQGTAPASLLATKRDKDGKALWTRPLCPHPQVATYTGSGGRSDAGNWACAEPTR